MITTWTWLDLYHTNKYTGHPYRIGQIRTDIIGIHRWDAKRRMYAIERVNGEFAGWALKDDVQDWVDLRDGSVYEDLEDEEDEDDEEERVAPFILRERLVKKPKSKRTRRSR